MQRSPDTLADLFAGLPGRGDKAALVQKHADGAQLLTYGTLAGDVGRHARGMQAAGLARGEYVILFASGGLDWITSFLATIAAGGVPIPLDPQTDGDTLRHVLGDSAAAWAVTDEARAKALAEAGFEGRTLGLDASEADGMGRRGLEAAAQALEPAAFEPGDTAVLFYTSGTTGPPKGVPLTQRNIAFQLEAVVEAGLVDADDRILQPLPPHHVYPLIVGTLAPLALGLTIVIPEAMLGPQIVAALRTEGVSFIVGVPRLYEALATAIETRIKGQAGLAGLYLRSAFRLSLWLRRRFGWRLGKLLLAPLHRRLAPGLEVLASGGAALDPGLALELEALGWRVAAGYGLTETSPLLTIKPPGRGPLGSVGRAVPGIELRIDTSIAGTSDDGGGEEGEHGERDPRAPEARPESAEGEILARGDGVFGGYLHHDKDAASFTPDGWFRTADLGHFDAEGFLHITGRRNTLLVTSAGKNIQPDELEQRYAEHELIEEIGILMDRRQLVAVVVPSMARIHEANLSAENGIRIALAEQGRKLATYKRVTRHVLSRDALPRTRLGKLQRHKLAELYRKIDADPEHQAPRAAPMPVAEMSEADRRRLDDERVARTWQLLADRYREHGLTPDTSLRTELGVDSLGWLELGTEVAERAGAALDEEQIAGIDTVRDLLDAVAASSGDAARKETPVERPDDYLSPRQRQWLEPLSPLGRSTARALYAIHGAAVRALFRLRVEGRDKLPADGQWIIASNHVSFLDPSVIAAALPARVLETIYWAGWTGYAFRNAFFRGISRLAQVVPIDPERGATSSLAFAAAVLARGKNLTLFPEGERSGTGELLPLKPGIGLLTAHYQDVTIVPVWISGSLEAWPRDRAWPRLRRISVTFGDPLLPREIIARDGRGDAANAITRALEEALEALRR